MSKVLCSDGRRYEILRWSECGPSDTVMEFHDTLSALGFLRSLMNDPLNMMNLRYALKEILDGVRDTSRLTDREILQKFAEQIVHGYARLVLREDLAEYFGGAGRPLEAAEEQAEEQPSAARRATAQTTTHWIEFRVVDDNTDQPVSGLKLRIKLPTGGVRELTSNSNGVVRVDNLTPGVCDLEKIIDIDALEVVQFG